MGTWAFFIALLVGLLILRTLRQLWSQRHFPPGPLSLPVIGGLWRIVTLLNENILIELAKQYGNICTLWLGHLPLVLLSGYEAVKEGLVDHAGKLSDRPNTPFFTLVARGKGIGLSNGHTWKQQRKFGIVTMRKLGLGKKGMEHQIEEEAQRLVETFAHAKGQPIDPSLPITNAVSNVICAVTFGHRFSLEDEKFKKLMEAVDIDKEFAGSIFHVLYEMFPLIMKHLPGPHKKAIAAIRLVDSFAKEEIKQHKEQQSFHKPHDFTDFYLLQMEKVRLFLNKRVKCERAPNPDYLIFDVNSNIASQIMQCHGCSGISAYRINSKLPYSLSQMQIRTLTAHIGCIVNH